MAVVKFGSPSVPRVGGFGGAAIGGGGTANAERVAAERRRCGGELEANSLFERGHAHAEAPGRTGVLGDLVRLGERKRRREVPAAPCIAALEDASAPVGHDPAPWEVDLVGPLSGNESSKHKRPALATSSDAPVRAVERRCFDRAVGDRIRKDA